jgi:hypothetical protein
MPSAARAMMSTGSPQPKSRMVSSLTLTAQAETFCQTKYSTVTITAINMARQAIDQLGEGAGWLPACFLALRAELLVVLAPRAELPVVLALRLAISPHQKKVVSGLYLDHKGQYHRATLGLLVIELI